MATSFDTSTGYSIIRDWMASKGHTPFDFQYKCWERYSKGYSGMVVAPTGFGKTFSVFIGVLIDFMNQPERYKLGLQLIWITPLRSLANDIARAMQQVIEEVGLDWTVEVRNGDTDPKIRKRQSTLMPDILLVTPESLHLLLAQKGRSKFFKSLQCVAVDEWHELMGTKRGILVELAMAYLSHTNKNLRIWGVTATIGNLAQAMEVLIPHGKKVVQVNAKLKKKIAVHAVFPDEVEKLPWAGHLGGKLAHKVVPIIYDSNSTIVFTNTRNQSEQWYQLLLEAEPDLSGLIALHHGSIDLALRHWIEDNLSEGKLKAVVATSSLDLGVDFKPVDTVVQVGSSKGVARFVQRAGRSGHSPYETSSIYFVPTHSLELIEVAALKEAIKQGKVEDRIPLVLTFDVLVQFMVTIALGGGFKEEELYQIIRSTHAFGMINDEEWQWCLLHITQGGKIGEQYDEFHKVVKNEEGLWVVTKRRIAMLHRMNIGVIASDAMMRVKFTSGGYIGMVEEYFLSKLKPGDKFILAGRVLELVRTKELTAFVRASSGKAMTPSWLGGRLPLTSNLSVFLRKKIDAAQKGQFRGEPELKFLIPLFERQQELSHLPAADEFLVELIHTREGYHLFMYPFEGRLIHEVMASLMAYRLSLYAPISFSMAMNDYGFELFSDSDIILTEERLQQILSTDRLMEDVMLSINAAEMAKHKFRDIAVISGMVLQNFPGAQRTNKSLQASAGLIFNVLETYDRDNLLLRQAYNEVFNQQLEEPRLIAAFERIHRSKIMLRSTHAFTPFSFPIKVDSLRQSLSSEDLAVKIEKLKMAQQKATKRK